MRPRSLLAASLLPSALGGQTPAPTCAHIQLRFVDTIYRLGTDAAPPPGPRIYRSNANGWSYALDDSVVLDERAIASVSVQSARLGSDTAWVVVARPTAAGAHALSDATGSHVGRYLGIVIGNELVAAPIIESQLVGTSFQLRGPVSRAVADSVASVARGAIDPSCRTPYVPGQTYFEFQVSKPVTIVTRNFAPRYPSELLTAHVSGEVLAQFVVDTLGRADMRTFHVLKSTDSLFRKAVEAALPEYQFTPAEIAGRKVRQLVQMPFQFNVEVSTPPPSSPVDRTASREYAALTARPFTRRLHRFSAT